MAWMQRAQRCHIVGHHLQNTFPNWLQLALFLPWAVLINKLKYFSTTFGIITFPSSNISILLIIAGTAPQYYKELLGQIIQTIQNWSCWITVTEPPLLLIGHELTADLSWWRMELEKWEVKETQQMLLKNLFANAENPNGSSEVENKWPGLGIDVSVLKISFGRQRDVNCNTWEFIWADRRFSYCTGAFGTDSSAHWTRPERKEELLFHHQPGRIYGWKSAIN